MCHGMQQIRKQDVEAIALEASKERDCRLRNAMHKQDLKKQIKYSERREVHDDTNMTDKEREFNLALIARAQEVVKTPQILPLRPCKDEES